MNGEEGFAGKAKLIRKWCLLSTTEAGSGHPTSCLSAADISTVLFDKYFRYDLGEPLNIYNDRFVLSKGHAAPLLYTLFAMAGAFPLSELNTLRKSGSILQGHPVPEFKYAEAATGSLGQGLSVGAGLALIAKRENLPFKTYVLLGDGELAEGQVWEAANFASYHKLDNLVVLPDINRLAQSGETMFGHDVEQYSKRFESFGFKTFTIDGHDYNEIDYALSSAVNNVSSRPVAIVAKTIKGKGISFLEDKDGWHGKALKKEELEKALHELEDVNDTLKFDLKSPYRHKAADHHVYIDPEPVQFNPEKEYATREVFGDVLASLGKKAIQLYVLDADVKNSTFTEKFLTSFPERFIECFIAEQNMVSVAAGLSRLRKIPVVATFAAFLTRAADQVRMACISGANIKFVGSHAGVSIGEDGPSQMGLEDIAMFGSLPGSIVLQPCDAVSTAALVPQMISHNGITYMRTLRPKTKTIYKPGEKFYIGGCGVLHQSGGDLLTIVATGITVFEALKAADELMKENIAVRVIDCYSVKPLNQAVLTGCLRETKLRVLIAVEDHFEHGGLGSFVEDELQGEQAEIAKMAVRKVSHSGKMEELLADAGIDSASIIAKVREYAKR